MANKKPTKLGEFILSEMRRRGLSQREFAELIGVAPSTIAHAVRHNPPQPSLDFLNKLSSGTSTDLFALVRMALPDTQGQISSETMSLAQRIERLPKTQREILLALIEGLLFKQIENIQNKGKPGGGKPNDP